MNDLPDALKHLVRGGGTLTALPIIETQAGDVAAYIPTNVISITDGQIFLESNLFNNGIRPAINVGISVSRVGGNAQIKSMRKVAGTLKLDQAQYRELEALQNLGPIWMRQPLPYWIKELKNVEILKQGQYQPLPVELQVAIIFCGTNGLLKEIPLNKVPDFEKDFIERCQLLLKPELEQISRGEFNDEIADALTNLAGEVAKNYKEYK